MKTQTKIAVALAALMSTGIASADMKINVGGASFGAGGDADTTTGSFTELGFNQFKATSLYETVGGAYTGNIIDTNINLADYGIPTGGLTAPSYGQTTIGQLSPLTPPAGVIVDAEGFNTTWGLVAEYYLTGNIGVNGTGDAFTTGPSFSGGFYNVYFDDYSNGLGKDFQVLGLTLTGSNLQIANLDLNFVSNFAKPGFFLVNGVDAASQIGQQFTLDTNVNPPIPVIGSLVGVTNSKTGGTYGARQTTLDGTISPIPEPASIALIGMGLIGFAVARRNKAA